MINGYQFVVNEVDMSSVLKKVKCIVADDNWARNKLTKGKIYEVLYEHDSMYRIVGDDKIACSCATNRFEVVDGGSSIIDANARMSYPKPAKQEASNEDMIFFRTPATPGYCVCGIQRNQCDYHRS